MHCCLPNLSRVYHFVQAQQKNCCRHSASASASVRTGTWPPATCANRDGALASSAVHLHTVCASFSPTAFSYLVPPYAVVYRDEPNARRTAARLVGTRVAASLVGRSAGQSVEPARTT